MACCTSFEGLGRDVCEVRIANRSTRTMVFKEAVYLRGSVINPGWPSGINDKDQAVVKSEGFLTGVSGYATFDLDGTALTIAFSNPGVGTNKLNVGTNGKGVWDEMESRDYKKWGKTVKTMGGLQLQLDMMCTSGSPNRASVEIFESRG